MSESKRAKQDIRKRQILRATLRLLRRYGAGVTTAQIAAEAHCSKETLYNWFADRDGIMLALVAEQAKGMNAALTAGFQALQGSIEERLVHNATLLLDIMTGEAVLCVNRVAMAQACESCRDLGQSVLADWNEQVVRHFVDLFEEGEEQGKLTISDKYQAFETLMGLLVGDRQRRLLLGEDARPAPNEMKAIAEHAIRRWMTLYTPA